MSYKSNNTTSVVPGTIVGTILIVILSHGMQACTGPLGNIGGLEIQEQVTKRIEIQADAARASRK